MVDSTPPYVGVIKLITSAAYVGVIKLIHLTLHTKHSFCLHDKTLSKYCLARFSNLFQGIREASRFHSFLDKLAFSLLS